MKEYRPISGRDHDGAHCSDLSVRLDAAKARRGRAAKGLCITAESHGQATHGVRCHRCAAVHRYGVAIVNERGLDALDLSDRRFLKFQSAAHAA